MRMTGFLPQHELLVELVRRDPKHVISRRILHLIENGMIKGRLTSPLTRV